MLSLLLAMTMAKPVYIATYFLGNGESGAYLAVSDDGYEFKPLAEPNVPLLKPTVGKDRLMRDPCLLRGPAGDWHMVWTTGWWDRSIGISHSKDLVNWDEPALLPVMEKEPSALNAWAPEIAYDERSKAYTIVWSSTVKGRFPETDRPDGDLSPDRVPLNHRYYATTTTDFRDYSPSRLVWDPGFNSIDATLIRDGARWVLFGKDETKAPKPAKHLFVAAGPRPTGPFVMLNERITGPYWAEGPTAVKDGSTYRVYFDRYMDGRWGAVESTDLINWQDVSERIKMPAGARHGTVLMVSPDVLKKLKAALANRLARLVEAG
jgi:hypothetical protein